MKTFIILILLTSIFTCTQAQNVGIGTTSPRPSAQLDVSSTNKGLLIPRMTTTQRKAITNPDFGLLVLDTDKGTLMMYDGQFWRTLTLGNENNAVSSIRTAAEAKENDRFGCSVAMDGNYTIIGSPWYKAGSLNIAGVVHVYEKNNNGWILRARLSPPDSSANSLFGYSVAISGEYAVVSAPNKLNGAIVSGKVYIYKRTGNNWALETSFMKNSPTSNEAYGFSVAVNAYASNGIIVAVSAPYSKSSGINRGEAFIYRKSGNTWSLLQTFRPVDLFDNNHFGYSISISGESLAISAPFQTYAPTSLQNAGAVYVYSINGSVYELVKKISHTNRDARFGYSISLDNDYLAISAPFAKPPSGTSPIVAIYRKTSNNWNLEYNIGIYQTSLKSINPNESKFGYSVALKGDNLLIGDPSSYDNLTSSTNSFSNPVGWVYFFKKSNSLGFKNTQCLKSDDNVVENDYFGMNVALSNDHFVISNSRATVDGKFNVGAVVFGEIK